MRPISPFFRHDGAGIAEGRAVLQGGIPSVLVCGTSGTVQDFRGYFEKEILPLRGRKGFILGMSDNVPPNADFARIEAGAGWRCSGVSHGI